MGCLFTQVTVFRDTGKPYLYRKSDRPHHWTCSYGWLLKTEVQPYIWRQLTATRGWDEVSIFTVSFALIWGPVFCSDSPPSAKLFKKFHQCALCRTVKHFTIGCKQRPRNWKKIRIGQSLKTPISCSYWLPFVTRLQLQTILSFVLDRQHTFRFY